MTHTDVAVHLIAFYEGVKLYAYRDQNGIWTIGYGHTAGVKIGDYITLNQAKEFLDVDLLEADKDVNAHVKVPLKQCQFDALCSFAFNLGDGHFEGSSCVKLLNEGKLAEAADHILLWNEVDGKPDEGLTNRRKAERSLFLS